MNNSRIRWECNNWYKTDEGLIQIVNQSGGRVLLNKKLSLIWQSINYESNFLSIYENVREVLELEEEDLTEILQLFKKNKLISIAEEGSLFNAIFG